LDVEVKNTSNSARFVLPRWLSVDR